MNNPSPDQVMTLEELAVYLKIPKSTFFAHWLTQSGRIENQISSSMASARVDMNRIKK